VTSGGRLPKLLTKLQTTLERRRRGEPVRNDSWTNDVGTCRQVARFLDDNRDHYHRRYRMIQESE